MQPASRLLFVDNLRVALTILVVVQHLAVTYGAAGLWYYMEPPHDALTRLVLTLFMLFNQGYFMGLFFLVAGYFTPGAFDRKGPDAFLRDRAVRLGAPLLVYTLLIYPLIALVSYPHISELVGPAQPLTFWQFYLLAFGPGPLWFLEVLLPFGILYALWRRLAQRQSTPAPGDAHPPTYPAILAFTLALTVVTFVLRIWVPMGLYLPIVGFPTASHVPQYAGRFIAGILAHRRSWFLSLPASMGWVGFGAAIGATILLVPIALGDGTRAFLGGVDWSALVYALWESILSVGMCLGLLTLFRNRFNHQGEAARFLSAHAYTVYILHAPVIVGLAIALHEMHLYPLLKFALVVPVAIPLCFLGAYLVRKLPFVRKAL